MCSGYTRGVSKRLAAVEPVWRQQIAAAVSRHGRLKEVADAAEMTSSQLQKIANGTNANPGVATLARIAAAIELTLPELMSGPRPEKESGHAERRTEGNPILAGLLAKLDTEAPAEDSVRGDILKAIAALNRALRRETVAGEPAAPPAKARR